MLNSGFMSLNRDHYPSHQWHSLAEAIHSCQKCTRLRKYCLKIASEKRKSFQKESYWGKPVSGFGDPRARLVLVGLAPAAHGANRTGRIFTGDNSGLWLYRALQRFGFSNQAASTGPGDGLVLRDAYVSCVVKCAPPDNKPSLEEQKTCVDQFLRQEIELLDQAQVWVALGQIAFVNLWSFFRMPKPRPKFEHGKVLNLTQNQRLILSYHPSQQNTFTGKLTEPMFDSIFQKARDFLTEKK